MGILLVKVGIGIRGMVLLLVKIGIGTRGW